ncbi:hypothetical protein GGH96_002184 [Coemansia sp. RSA 1972]|nr:hypothetical protein GGH96_002184 [Coemansia sp. RSA 1972]
MWSVCIPILFQTCVLVVGLPVVLETLVLKTQVLTDEATIQAAHDELHHGAGDFDVLFATLHDLADAFNPENMWHRSWAQSDRRNWFALDDLSSDLESLIDHDIQMNTVQNKQILFIVSIINEISKSLF